MAGARVWYLGEKSEREKRLGSGDGLLGFPVAADDAL
jgi:hypothetical protein